MGGFGVMQDKKQSVIARSPPAMPTSLGCELCPGASHRSRRSVFFRRTEGGGERPSSCVDAGPGTRQLLEEPARGEQ